MAPPALTPSKKRSDWDQLDGPASWAKRHRAAEWAAAPFVGVDRPSQMPQQQQQQQQQWEEQWSQQQQEQRPSTSIHPSPDAFGRHLNLRDKQLLVPGATRHKDKRGAHAVAGSPSANSCCKRANSTRHQQEQEGPPGAWPGGGATDSMDLDGPAGPEPAGAHRAWPDSEPPGGPGLHGAAGFTPLQQPGGSQRSFLMAEWQRVMRVRCQADA